MTIVIHLVDNCQQPTGSGSCIVRHRFMNTLQSGSTTLKKQVYGEDIWLVWGRGVGSRLGSQRGWPA